MARRTAIDLELQSIADGAMALAGQSDQLFAMLAVMSNEGLSYLMSIIVIILVLSNLVASSGAAALLIVHGLGAIQTAMVIEALPFGAAMVLIRLSPVKLIWRESRRKELGLPNTHAEMDEADGAQPGE